MQAQAQSHRLISDKGSTMLGSLELYVVIVQLGKHGVERVAE
jgi:hypothetical protein